jgi:wyosine [tRNA(Phe)-imidazoG37] synthetase (radical SAM superfamily)
VSEGHKYLFGPVASRRLGRSLGVDIVPFKVCTLDCVYCQLGRTSKKSIRRRDYVPVAEVLAELRARLDDGVQADFVTISGSGEPTLNSRLGEIIEGMKKITDIPVALLTNGTLLYRRDVRADCAKADVVLPSLDAADEETFKRVNRPHKDISIERLISGLCAFRKEFAGQIWLEVFLVEGTNTSPEQIARIKEAVGRIGPDRIQLNTAMRPTAEADVKKLDSGRLQAIAKEFGEKCGIVAGDLPGPAAKHMEAKGEQLLSVLKRRPCSVDDVCSGLGMARNEALKYIRRLQQQGVVESERRDGIIFFKAN